MNEVADNGARGALVHVTVELVRVLERAGLTNKSEFAHALDGIGRTIMQYDHEEKREAEALALADVARVLHELAEDDPCC